MPVAKQSRNKRLKKWVKILLLAAVLLLVYSRVIEPRSIQLTTYHIAVPGLPSNQDGFKIVQLSDLHRRYAVPDDVIRKAVKIANSTHADAVVLTGDYVGHTKSDIDPCFDMLKNLHTRLGSYAVLGNHDYWTDSEAVSSSIRKHRINLITNKSAKVADGVYIIGVDDEWTGHPDSAAAFKNVNSRACCIMICHSPMSVTRFKGHRGLLITGHTHGGQIDIPGVPRNLLPGLKGWKYIRGWYSTGDIMMYVNRGIGMINPAIRFHCRPEVTLYVLHPAKGSRPYLIMK